MDTYFDLIYETFYQMIHKIVVSDNRLASLFILCVCASVLIGFCVFMYYLYAGKSSRSFCNEFWWGLFCLLPIVGLVTFIIVEMYAKKCRRSIMKICYRKIFWAPVVCNALLLCLSGVLPIHHWVDVLMECLGTQETVFAKEMGCFLFSGLLGMCVLAYRTYQSRNMRHIFKYGCETADGESIKGNIIQIIKNDKVAEEVNVGKWLCENGSRSMDEKGKDAMIELVTDEVVDIPYSFVKNKELEAYYLLRFEDDEDYTYAEYASNEQGDKGFIVTNVVPETDNLIFSYVISLMYGILISFPIYYCIIMNLR